MDTCTIVDAIFISGFIAAMPTLLISYLIGPVIIYAVAKELLSMPFRSARPAELEADKLEVDTIIGCLCLTWPILSIVISVCVMGINDVHCWK